MSYILKNKLEIMIENHFTLCYCNILSRITLFRKLEWNHIIISRVDNSFIVFHNKGIVININQNADIKCK